MGQVATHRLRNTCPRMSLFPLPLLCQTILSHLTTRTHHQAAKTCTLLFFQAHAPLVTHHTTMTALPTPARRRLDQDMRRLNDTSTPTTWTIKTPLIF